MGNKQRFIWILLKEILFRPGVLAVSITYFVLQLAFNFIAWTVSPKDQARYQLIQVLTWRVWIAVTPLLTIFLIVLIVHAAVQAVAKREAQNQGEREKLQARIHGLKAERDQLKFQLTKVLKPEDRKRLLTFQKEGGELSRFCLGGGRIGIEESIDKWEKKTADALLAIFGEERRGLFLHAHIVPVQMHGHQPYIMELAGRMNARMSVLNSIIKEASN